MAMKKASIEEMFGAATKPGRLVNAARTCVNGHSLSPPPSKLVCCVPETSLSVHRERPDRQTVYISIVIVESLEDGTGTESVGQRESLSRATVSPCGALRGSME
jgi:hypothetical protein